MPKLKFVFGIKQTGVVVVFFTEFAFVAERNFNVVVDFRSYAYAEFHAETIECFAVNRIGAAVGQGYDRTAGVVDQIISQANLASGFRLMPFSNSQERLILAPRTPVNRSLSLAETR